MASSLILLVFTLVKDELIVFNNTVAENPISGRHLTRMWGLLRRYVLQYRRNLAAGYGNNARSRAKSEMLKVESFAGMPDLFDGTGELIDVEVLEHCLIAGIASDGKGFRGLRSKSHDFLLSYAGWRLAQERLSVAPEA